MINGLKEARFGRRMAQWNLSLLSGISQSKTSLVETGFKTPADKTMLTQVPRTSTDESFLEDDSQTSLER